MKILWRISRFLKELTEPPVEIKVRVVKDIVETPDGDLVEKHKIVPPVHLFVDDELELDFIDPKTGEKGGRVRITAVSPTSLIIRFYPKRLFDEGKIVDIEGEPLSETKGKDWKMKTYWKY